MDVFINLYIANCSFGDNYLPNFAQTDKTVRNCITFFALLRLL